MSSEQAAMAVLRASRPTFRNAHDKVAFAVHSAFLAAGFSLLAVGPATNSDDLSLCKLLFCYWSIVSFKVCIFVLRPLFISGFS
jgi:hypothetical protein